jgi:hypothetical protein
VAERTFLAVVHYSGTPHDRGNVYTDGTHLWVCWPDGCIDHVERNKRGFRHEHGVALPVVSRDERDAVVLPDNDCDGEGAA